MRTHKITIESLSAAAKRRHDGEPSATGKQYYAGMVQACDIINRARRGDTDRLLAFLSAGRGAR